MALDYNFLENLDANAAPAPDTSSGGGTGNAIKSYLQFLMLHPQGAAPPNPQPGATGGYWNAQPAPQAAQAAPMMASVPAPPQPGIQPMNPSMTGVNYKQLIPSVGKGPSMPMGGGGGGGGGQAGGIMGALTGGGGGSSMMDITKLLGLLL